MSTTQASLFSEDIDCGGRVRLDNGRKIMDVPISDLSNGVIRVSPQQALCAESCDVLGGVCKQLIAQHGDLEVLQIDLAEVGHIDSMGLGMLIGLRAHARNFQVKLMLVNVHARLYMILRLARLDEVFDCTRPEQT